MLNSRNSGYQVVTDVTAREAVNFDHYGIDEEGPVPDVQSDYAVSVPDTITTLTHNQELSLQEARDAVFQTGDHSLPSGIADCFFLFNLLFMIYSIDFMYMEYEL